VIDIKMVLNNSTANKVHFIQTYKLVKWSNMYTCTGHFQGYHVIQ